MEKILIDLKKLNKKLNYIFKTYGVSEVIKKKVYEAVEKSTIQPTIDPVKHGKWVKMPSKEVEEATWCCSECSYPVGIWMIKEKFCPNCGARMDGE